MVYSHTDDFSESRDSQFFAQVRRMEAVSFRSFPSTTTHFDGTWAIRLTAGHPAKRLNSVNPLDPSDHLQIDRRIKLAQQRFDSFGRPLVFRQTPLAPAELEEMFDNLGWERFEESIVMVANLQEMELGEEQDQLPMKDTGKWVDSFLSLSNETTERKPGLVEVISAIQGAADLYSRKVDDQTVSALRCVRDNELAGVFDLVTHADHQRQGHARTLIGSALKLAKMSGAKLAWLQVVADNPAALRLYERFGFAELYRYSYRKPKQSS